MEQLIPIDNVLEEIKIKSALKYRKIVFIEDFTTESCYKIEYLLNKIKENDDKLNLPKEKRVIEIDFQTYGGECYACFGLISLIDSMKKAGYHIIGTCTAYSMSCGFLTFVACSERRIAKYATLMYHSVASGTFGKLQTMKESLDEAHRINEISKDIVVENTNIDRAKLDDVCDRKIDWYINAEEAIAMGIADKII